MGVLSEGSFTLSLPVPIPIPFTFPVPEPDFAPSPSDSPSLPLALPALPLVGLSDASSLSPDAPFVSPDDCFTVLSVGASLSVRIPPSSSEPGSEGLPLGFFVGRVVGEVVATLCSASIESLEGVPPGVITGAVVGVLSEGSVTLLPVLPSIVS